jgi:hypothetical protein
MTPAITSLLRPPGWTALILEQTVSGGKDTTAQ